MTARREWLLLALAWLAAMLIAFRDPVLSGFDLGFGDRADAIIEISLLEHWRNVFTGHVAWNQPLYFHPHGGTLGYNDGYFLFGLVFSFWRIWFDPFLADTLNAATFKTIGFFASWWLVRRTLGWQAPVALLAATLFTIANGMTLQAVHAQLQSIGLLPVAMILAIATLRAELAGRKARARLTGGALALLTAAWLLTAFYLVWFALWFLCVFAACWLAVSGNWRPPALRAMIRAHATTALVIGAVFVIAAIPFLRVYLPKALETGGHGYMISYLVTPIDPVNVGTGNLLWGWIFRGVEAIAPLIVGPDPRVIGRLIQGEHESGFPLILFALIVMAGLRILRPGPERSSPPVLRAYALAILISWLLAVRIWVVSPWLLVHFLVPGASAIRVVVRYQLFLILPVLLLVAAAFRHRLAEALRSRTAWAGLLVALLLAEQINLTPVAALSRRQQIADFGAIPRPPAPCRSFYVVRSRHAETPPPRLRDSARPPADIAPVYPHNVDAMLLAQLWRLPTIGGYATFTPPDWTFADPREAGHDAGVMRYIESHRLRGVCRLDMGAPQPWRIVR